MSKQIILSASGTAGHLKSAIALAEELKNYSVSFLAAGLQGNPFFTSFPFQQISAEPLRLRKPFFSLWSITKGIWQSIQVLRKKRTDLVIGFGSYHTFPVMVAAKLLGIKRIVYEPNLFPGKVVRLSCRLGALALIRYKESRSFLKGESLEIGWEEFVKTDREKAREYFSLSQDRLTLLIFGGSQGAQFFNEKLPSMLHSMKDLIQVLHFVGRHGSLKKVEEEYEIQKIPALCKVYESRMDLAYAAADLCFCRSGAGTLQELIQTGTPAFLIPFSLSSEDHQNKNAYFFVKEVGGGWMMAQKEVSKEKIELFFSNLSLEKLSEKREKLYAFYHSQKKEPTLKQVIERVLHA